VAPAFTSFSLCKEKTSLLMLRQNAIDRIKGKQDEYNHFYQKISHTPTALS